MSCDSVTVSSIVASLRPPPGVGKGRMHTLFSVSSHQHAKPEPVHGFLPSPPVIGPIRTYPNHRSRSRSAGLECLADLAEKELSTTSLLPSPGTALLCAEPVVDQASTSGSSSEDEESMPPPPPRRLRSNSNPEAMFHPVSSRRPRLLLPDQFLESELAQVRRNARSCSPPSIPEDSQWLETATFESTANDNAMQLLQETRSRLLEDLSQSSLQQRKSATTTSVLPHDLDKYKDVSLYCCLCSKLSLVLRFGRCRSIVLVLDTSIFICFQVYNKDGRIGIYTVEERSAILARFHDKRQRRNWNKKIRYNCRKSLADRRVRVKGRFVKAGAMPDTSDPEAGFQPTADQPYRRARRHTIT